MITSFNEILTSALTPTMLISGVGLMMLCMTNRYNSTTDRIRKLIKRREASGLKNEPCIDTEIRYVFRRNIHYDKKSDEIMQIGVELIGSGTFQADAEAVFLCAATLQKLFGRDFLLEIGHVDFVNLLLKQFDLPPEREEAVRLLPLLRNLPREACFPRRGVM